MTSPPHGPPPLNPEPEPYLSRREMATLMGISVDSLDDLVKQGMPSSTWGLRRRVFRASAALAWADKHAARREGTGGA